MRKAIILSAALTLAIVQPAPAYARRCRVVGAVRDRGADRPDRADAAGCGSAGPGDRGLFDGRPYQRRAVARRARRVAAASSPAIHLAKTYCRHAERGRHEAISHSTRRFSTQARSANGQCDVSPAPGGTAASRSRATIDLAIAGRLRGLAGEFLTKAEELEAEEDDDLFRLSAAAAAAFRRGNGPRLKAKEEHRASSGIVSGVCPSARRPAPAAPRRFRHGTNSTGVPCTSRGRAGVTAMSKAQEAWSRAAICVDRAQAADSEGDAAILQSIEGFVGPVWERPLARRIARGGDPRPGAEEEARPGQGHAAYALERVPFGIETRSSC